MEVLRCIPGYDSFVLEALDVLRQEDEVIDLNKAVVARFLEKEENYFFVVTDDGEMVGSATAVRVCSPISERDRAILTDIRVLPARRGQGIGKALLASVISCCARDGMEVLTAVTNAENVPALHIMYRLGGVKLGKADGVEFAFIL